MGQFGPAHVGEVRAAADAEGRIVAYEYHGWQHNWSIVETSAQLAGLGAERERPSAAQQVSPLNLGAMYDVANVKLVNHRVPAAKYLQRALAALAAGSVVFLCLRAGDRPARLSARIGSLRVSRSATSKTRDGLAFSTPLRKAAKWSRAGGVDCGRKAKMVTGRGIGVGTHLASYGAAVAEIEVNKETGRIVAKHMYGAIDAGLAVNPGNIENQISGQLVQTVSRMLKEEVTFNRTNVTSLDWNTYPILRFEECPAVTPIVVQRLDEPSTGAGEEVMAAAAAAIANAFFDATGVRMQEFPLTPKRVLAALAGA